MKKKVRIKSLPKAQFAGQPSLVLTPQQKDIWYQNQNMFGTPPQKTISVPDYMGSTNTTPSITEGMIPFSQNQTQPFNAANTFNPFASATMPRMAPSVTPLLTDVDQFNEPYGPLTESNYYANVAEQYTASPEGTTFDDNNAFAPGYQGMSQKKEQALSLPQGTGFLPFMASSVFGNMGRRNERNQIAGDFRNRFLSDAMYAPLPSDYSGTRGDYVTNQGLGINFRPDEAVYGQFGKIAKYGGQMKRKIKITGLPQQAYGGTQNKASVDEMYPYNSNVRRAAYSDMLDGNPDQSVRQYAEEVPREIANIEAEKGETIVKPLDNGLLGMYKIGGKRHYEGGTPLQATPNDFIFSDTKDMKIKDPAILESFGMKYKKGGFTPAKISNKFNLNDPSIQKPLNDPNADYLQKATAERMYDNYLSQLGKLALVQEGRKGFPQGAPDIAMPYMQKVGMDPSMFMPDVMTPQDASMQMGKAQVGNNPLKNPAFSISAPQPIGLGYDMPIPNINNNSSQPALNPSNQPAAQPAAQQNTRRPSANQSTPSSKYSDFITYNRDILNDFKQKGIEFNLPDVSVDYDVTPGMQKTRTSGVFGTQDWGSGDFFNDFKERNKWYFEQNPDFNPSSSKDVYDFQNKYNDKIYKDALAAGYTEQQAREVQKKMGFEESEPGEANPRGTDRKFGQYTWSRSGLDFKKKPGDSSKTPDPGPTPGKVPPITPQRADPGKYYIQDLMNTGLAAADRLGVKKYLPYDAGMPAPALMDPTFYDPSRELAATGEMANMVTQNLAQFVGPQALSSRASQIQGNSAKAVADTLGRYNNLNVGVANQFEQGNKALINDFNLKNAMAKSNYYDKTVIANQQYDNAKRAANARLMGQATNAITNKAMTQVLNSIFPEYSIDPTVGGEMMYIPSQRTVNNSAMANNQMQPNDINFLRKQYKETFPNLTDAEIDKELLRTINNPRGQSSPNRQNRMRDFLDFYGRSRMG
jgi:hypothetical protein